jgi:hypothetical protein
MRSSFRAVPPFAVCVSISMHCHVKSKRRPGASMCTNATYVAILLASSRWRAAYGIRRRQEVSEEGLDREAAFVQDVSQCLARHGATRGYRHEGCAAFHPQYVAAIVESKHAASLERTGALMSGASGQVQDICPRCPIPLRRAVRPIGLEREKLRESSLGRHGRLSLPKHVVFQLDPYSVALPSKFSSLRRSCFRPKFRRTARVSG